MNHNMFCLLYWSTKLSSFFLSFLWLIVTLYGSISLVNIHPFFTNSHFPWCCQCWTIGLSCKGSCNIVGISWMFKWRWPNLQICTYDQSGSATCLELRLLIRVSSPYSGILYSHLLPTKDVREGWQTFLSYPLHLLVP